MTPQRQLGSSVAACLAGAGLAAYGATRVWSVQITERPGLTSLRSTTTGAAQSPWLIGLALVALAGAGALLATRGLPRRLLGALLTATGLGLIVAAITGRAGLDPGSAGLPATVWPIVCTLAGALITWAGLTAARHAHHWPAMGSRYDRTAPTPPPTRSRQPASAAPPGSPAGSPSAGSSVPASSDPPAELAAPSSGRSSAELSVTASGSASAESAVSASGVSPAGVPERFTGSSSAGPPATDPRKAGATSREVDPARSATRSTTPQQAAPPADPAPAEDRPSVIAQADTRAAWDALDRGDDPTIH